MNTSDEGFPSDEANGDIPSSLPSLQHLAQAYQLNEAAVNEPKRLREGRQERFKEILGPLASPDVKDLKDTPQYPVPPGTVNENDLPPDVPFSVSLHSAGTLGNNERLESNLTGLHNLAYQVTSEGNGHYVNDGGLSDIEAGKVMDEAEFSHLQHGLEIRGTLGNEEHSQTSMTLGWVVDPSSMIVREEGEHGSQYRVIGPDDEQFQTLERLMEIAARGVTQDPQLQAVT